MAIGPEKRPAQPRHPLENIGSALAASLLRQNAFRVQDVKNGLVAGDFAATTKAIEALDLVLKDATVVREELDTAVGNIKSDLGGNFPQINLGVLRMGIAEPVVGIPYRALQDESPRGGQLVIAPTEAAKPGYVLPVNPVQPREEQLAEPTTVVISPPVEIQAEAVKEPGQIAALSVADAQLASPEVVASADPVETPKVEASVDYAAENNIQSPFEKMLEEIADGKTVPDRMKAIRQAVVFMGMDILEPHSRGTGLTSRQQKLLLAALDVNEDGSRAHPTKEAMVEVAFEDLLSKEPRLSRPAKLKVHINNSKNTIETAVNKLVKAATNRQDIDDNILTFLDLINADARTADLSPAALLEFMQHNISEHDYKMILKKVEEDVKKTLNWIR